MNREGPRALGSHEVLLTSILLGTPSLEPGMRFLFWGC